MIKSSRKQDGTAEAAVELAGDYSTGMSVAIELYLRGSMMQVPVLHIQ